MRLFPQPCFTHWGSTGPGTPGAPATSKPVGDEFLSESRRQFLRAIRSRIRVAWLVASAQRVAPLVGVAIAVLYLAQWLTDFSGAFAGSLIVTASALVALVVGALTVAISDWDASRAAERGLEAGDVLTTALEFGDETDLVHQAIQVEADQIAAAARPSAAIPITAEPRRIVKFGAAVAVALVIGLLPPLGNTPALSTDLEQVLANEADRVDELADAVEASVTPEADEVADELRRLAEELRRARTLEEAQDALDRTQASLDTMLDPDFLNQKMAAQGLAQDLALRPLQTGMTGDAASQFEQLADQLSDLSPGDLAAAAHRLRGLADSQESGNPDLADSLRRAADSLDAGDLSDAADALSRAAGDQRQGTEQSRGQQAVSETQRALDAIADRLDPNASGNGGEPGGENGDNEGGGENGEGSQGQGGGVAGGDVGGGGADPSGDETEGGTGTGNVGGTDTIDHDPTEGHSPGFYEPVDPGLISERIQVGIGEGTGSGGMTGTGDGDTDRGETLTPEAQLLARYIAEAHRSLGRMQLPPSMRGIVRSYFDRLSAEVR